MLQCHGAEVREVRSRGGGARFSYLCCLGRIQGQCVVGTWGMHHDQLKEREQAAAWLLCANLPPDMLAQLWVLRAGG